MIVREYTDADFAQLKQLHAESGFAYNLPDPGIFFSRNVIEGDNSIGLAAFLKLTAEAYLICNPTWRTPAWRLDALKAIQHKAYEDCRREMVKEVTAFLPPQVEKTFGRRLEKLGWRSYSDPWKIHYFEVP